MPRRDIGKLHEYLRGALGAEYALDCLEQRKLWLDPASVAAWRGPSGERIEVYRHLQGPGEYVATDYGAAHWGVNLGVGWKAAVNFAFGEWRAAAEGVHEQYRKLERATGLRRNYRSVPDFEGKEWEEEEGEELEELEGEEGRREGREGARALRLQVRRIRRVFREARRDEDDAVGKDDRDVDGGTEGLKGEPSAAGAFALAFALAGGEERGVGARETLAAAAAFFLERASRRRVVVVEGFEGTGTAAFLLRERKRKEGNQALDRGRARAARRRDRGGGGGGFRGGERERKRSGGGEGRLRGVECVVPRAEVRAGVLGARRRARRDEVREAGAR